MKHCVHTWDKFKRYNRVYRIGIIKDTTRWFSWVIQYGPVLDPPTGAVSFSQMYFLMPLCLELLKCWRDYSGCLKEWNPLRTIRSSGPTEAHMEKSVTKMGSYGFIWPGTGHILEAFLIAHRIRLNPQRSEQGKIEANCPIWVSIVSWMCFCVFVFYFIIRLNAFRLGKCIWKDSWLVGAPG